MSHQSVTKLAEKYGKTPAQVILRWHIQQPNVIAVPKSQTPARIRENLDIFDFALEAAEMASISALAIADGRLCEPEFSPRWD
jgi:diketogulonate reductase-like aldo/keto reductase